MIQKTRATLKKSFTAVSALLLFSGFTGCSGKVPVWNGKIYAGSSGVDGVERRQDAEIIKCASAEFDHMMCMTYADFEKFYETYVLGCKSWIKGMEMIQLQLAVDKYNAIKASVVPAQSPH